MGHAEHFLSRLDRVSGADLDLALTLYRDDVLVRHVLSTIELPEGVDRVALALRDEHRGPFVLVSREGRFITCLGEGMSPRPHPVVTPAQLGALTRDVFQCRALSRELDSEGDHKRALRWHRERLLHAGPALSREEFDFLQRFEPLLRGRYIYELSASLSGFWGCYRAMDRVHRSRLGEAHLRVLWEGSWMAQHLAVLASRGLEFGLLNGNLPGGYDLYGSVHMVAAMVSTSSVVRAAYLTAQVGTEALPFFEGVCTQGAQRVTDDFALVALARRHRSERSQVLAWIERSKLKHGPEADTYAALMQGALDVDREAAERRLAEFSLTCLSAEHAALSPAQRERVGPLEDVPTAVAAALLCAREGYYHSSPEALEATSHAVAWASTAEPEELFVPRQYTPLLGARWSPERSRALLDRIRGAHLRKTPARKDTQVGRNDECPCRSGRKYKRCCGAG